MKTPDIIRENLPSWAGRVKEPAEQIAARVLWPTVTFSDELAVDLGGKHCRVFPTPGHSPDSVSVLVLEGRVLFTGDAAVTGIVPAVQFYSADLSEASQRVLATLDAEVLVTGHGPVVQDRAQVRDWLLWQADYLARVRDRVRLELERGLSPDLVVEEIAYDEFIGDRLPADRHNMPGRHFNTVNKIIQEELAART
jgi:glyoxylase-like metal-dependent hydrolase (beta-lactamase superfamily II)